MSATDNPPPEVFRLEDLLLRPELLLPPPAVIPRLAWEGRVTLLASREKVGKSTLMGQAVAALSKAPTPFLSDDIETGGRTLWLGLDEPMPDIVRRLAAQGAKGGVDLMLERPGVQALYDLIISNGTRLVVIDTLTEFCAGWVDDANSPTQIQPILKTLRRTAQDTKVGIILIHHASKAGGYRDSTQIGAGVDAIIEMTPDETDPTYRQCKCRGRVVNGDFRMAFTGGVYEIVAGTIPLDLQVQRMIQSNPGCSTRQVVSQVGARTEIVLTALTEIEHANLIENRGDGRRSAWFSVRGKSNSTNDVHAGNGRETLKRPLGEML